MEEQLRALLLADATVVGLVGDRVSWGGRPQGEGYPAIVLYLISELPDYSMGGSTGLREARVQVDSLGETAEAALTLHRAAYAVLDGYSGVLAPIRFGGIFQVGRRDTTEQTDAETWSRVSADYQIWSALA